MLTGHTRTTNLCPEMEVLLRCTRQQLTEDSSNSIRTMCRRSDFRWHMLLRASINHKVAPLLITHLLSIDTVSACIPKEILARWSRLTLKNAGFKGRQSQAITRIAQAVASESLKIMLLKGAALEVLVYQKPWLIQSADADILIGTPYCELAESLRDELSAIQRDNPIEIDFERHHDIDMNRVIDVDYPRLWEEATVTQYQGAPVRVMSPEDLLLCACINLCRKRFRQLKGIMAVNDILCAHPALDWSRFAAIAQRWEANRIAYTALLLAEQLLDASNPTALDALLAIGATRRQAIRALCRSVGSRVIATPVREREPFLSMMATGMLRVASFHVRQISREIRAQRELRRFRALNRLAVE